MQHQKIRRWKSEEIEDEEKSQTPKKKQANKFFIIIKVSYYKGVIQLL